MPSSTPSSDTPSSAISALSIARIRRDRHGRGLRAPLAPRGIPLHRSRARRFDEVVLDAVDHLESHWPGDLADIDFAVDDVPVETSKSGEFDPDVVSDRGVALGRVIRAGASPRAGAGRVMVVIYRRPIEARSVPGEERSQLVFALVAELVSQLNGKDPDDLHRE